MYEARSLFLSYRATVDDALRTIAHSVLKRSMPVACLQAVELERGSSCPGLAAVLYEAPLLPHNLLTVCHNGE